jgi:peptidoglycan/LPS O-acetylase OafA/YrhL
MSDVVKKAKPASFFIPSLDGVRAFSFLLVFLAHAGTPFIPGGFGVTVFFFLSGYLITTLLRREAEASGRISLRAFYLRRVLRILPPFYLVLFLALLLSFVGVLPGTRDWSMFAAQTLHYSNFYIIAHGWDGLLPGTGVYWSLAVEEHFYLVFPALYLLMRRAGLSPRGQHAVLLSLCAVVLCWRCYIVFHQGLVGDRTYLGSDTRFDSMLFGCALAVWKNPVMDFERSERPSWLLLGAAAGGVVLLLASFLLRAPAFRESIRYTMQGVGLYPLFHLLVRYPHLAIGRLLNLRAIRFVGTLSFSLYLIHHVVIVAFQQHVPGSQPLQAVLALLLSGLLALGIWHFVERPLGRLRARLHSAAAS